MRLNTRKISKSLLLVSLLLTPLFCFANPIRFAVDPFPPWVIVEKDQDIKGIDIRIAKRIAEELQLTPEFIICPFARCLKMMELGEADAMVNLFLSNEREHYIRYVEPHLTINPPKVFYLNIDQTLDITEYEQLYALNVGVVRDTIYFEKFDADNKMMKVPLVTDVQLIDMLLKRRIDTFIGTEATIDYLLSISGRSDKLKKATFRYQSQRATHFGLSKQSPLIAEFSRIQAAISHLKTSGELKRVSESFWDDQLSYMEELHKEEISDF